MNRGRFAPTPSGELHIGNAMTALLAWLQIRKSGGAFVLRMEDLDRPRCREEYARHIMKDLRWLGIDWDEGPDIGGSYGSYVQGSRYASYREAFHRLEREVYPCFCSRKELRNLASAPHGLSSAGAVYPGFCKNLTTAERTEKAKKKNPSFRFALPDRRVNFDDLVLGAKAYSPGFGGDFVVRRADGIMSYQLAVVVDDAAMQITDVLRGADLLDSTPRQILLYQALGLPVPRFAHVPLLYGPDGKRLSKRHGSWITVAAMREKGIKPETAVGLLAYLSKLTDSLEPVKPRELIETFDLQKIPKKPVCINESLLRPLDGRGLF